MNVPKNYNAIKILYFFANLMQIVEAPNLRNLEKLSLKKKKGSFSNTVLRILKLHILML